MVTSPATNWSTMQNEVYTVKDVARITGKSPVTVRQLVRAHGLGRKMGRDWILSGEDLKSLRNLPGPGRPRIHKQEMEKISCS